VVHAKIVHDGGEWTGDDGIDPQGVGLEEDGLEKMGFEEVGLVVFDLKTFDLEELGLVVFGSEGVDFDGGQQEVDVYHPDDEIKQARVDEVRLEGVDLASDVHSVEAGVEREDVAEGGDLASDFHSAEVGVERADVAEGIRGKATEDVEAIGPTTTDRNLWWEVWRQVYMSIKSYLLLEDPVMRLQRRGDL
jgi:hypothetical protein